MNVFPYIILVGVSNFWTCNCKNDFRDLGEGFLVTRRIEVPSSKHIAYHDSHGTSTRRPSGRGRVERGELGFDTNSNGTKRIMKWCIKIMRILYNKLKRTKNIKK